MAGSPRGGGDQRVELFLGRKNMQAVADRCRGPFGKQHVDPLRAFQRRPQAAAGRGGQHQGSRAAMQVGIEQRDVVARAVCQLNRQVDRDRGGADTAAHACYCHDPSAARRCLGAPGERGLQSARDDLAIDRLAEIFLHAQAADDLAIELHVLDIADDEDAHAGLDVEGEVLKLAERVGFTGDVDQERRDGRVETLQAGACLGYAARTEFGRRAECR